MLDLSLLIVPFIAFLAVVILIMPFRRLARVMGLVDIPDDRKQHIKAVPPVGGLVLFAVFIAASFISYASHIQDNWPLYVSLAMLLVSGAFDDKFHIPAGIKFFIHIFAASLIVVVGGARVHYLGDLFGMGAIGTDFMAYPFSIVAVVLLINAMNLMDGMDGLVGGISVVMFVWFAIAATLSGLIVEAAVILTLVGCLVGFLVFNMRNPWRRGASLFLGDAGSMSIGLAIAWFGITLSKGPEASLEPIVVAWIIGFPIFDTCAQFYRRVREGNHPFAPDRGHFHHHFIDAGVPVRWAAVIIISIVGIMGAIGFFAVAAGVPQVILTIGWVILLISHIAISSKPERYVRLISHIFKTKI